MNRQNRQEQMINGFTEMMKGFWGNQDLQAPSMEEIKVKRMTREEAIFCEKSYIGETNCVDCKYYGTDTCQSRESHKMAIKALEQEPITDRIEYGTDGNSYRLTISNGKEFEQEPKTGHWIDTDEWRETVDGFEQWGYFRKCSKCGYVFKFLEIDNYCPNCGIKMVES